MTNRSEYKKSPVLSLALHSFETDSRILRACGSLIQAGYPVKVGALHEPPLPLRQMFGPVEVERVRLWTRSWPKRRPIQFIKYIEWAIRVAWRYRHYRILHCNDLNTLPAGVLIKALSLGRARILYDAHEFESNHKANQGRFSIWMLQRLEGTLIRFADRVVTVSQGIAAEYSRIYSITPPTVVMNCPRLQESPDDDQFRSRFGIRKDQIIFLTQGWLRPNRGIEVMLTAFESLDDDSMVLIVMGRGILEELVKKHAARSANIFHQPVVPPSQVIAHTSAADYGIALIRGASFSYQHCLPNKLFEYLMGRLPVVVSDLPEMRAVVNEMEIGVVCEQFTAPALITACKQLMNLDQEKLSKNVDNARSHFNWNVQQEVWLSVVAELVE